MFGFDDDKHRTLSLMQKGSVAEKTVAILLETMGWQVFPTGNHGATCDILIMDLDGLHTFRVEVTTAHIVGKKSLRYPPHDRRYFDILALWIPERNSAVFKAKQAGSQKFAALPRTFTLQDLEKCGLVNVK